MTEHITALRKLLVQISRVRPKPDGFHYSCVQDFVLKHGLAYTPAPNPYPQGLPKRCFENSMTLARNNDLIYVEGFAALPQIGIPIQHAWCVAPGSKNVIDPTSKDLVAYLGVPFKVYDAYHLWLKGGCMIDNWKDGFPLLRMNDQELQQLIDTR